MKKIIMTVVLCSVLGMAAAQTNVSNIRVQQQDTLLFVMYDLAMKANIDVYVSYDNGVNFQGPLKHVTGAVGKGVLPEKDKIFIWDIVKEAGYVDYPSTIIKIASSGEKPLAVPEGELTLENARGQYLPASFGFEWGFAPRKFDFGVRITKNILPYFGLDIIKLKGDIGPDFLSWDGDESFYSVQLLTGFRGASPHFGKNKNIHVYTSLRMGPGYFWHDYYWGGWENDGYYREDFSFCLEWDTGLHFGHFFVGTTLSYLTADTDYYGYDNVYFGLRLGIDIGNRKLY
jgi:hypothetical protein